MDDQTLTVTHLSTFHELYRQQADRFGDAPLIQSLNAADLSYRGFADQIQTVIEALTAWGIGRGDRVLIQLPGGAEPFVMMHAAGTVAVSVVTNPMAGAMEMEHFIRFITPKAIVLRQGVDSPARALAQQYGVRVLDIIPTPQSGAGTFHFAEAPPPASGSPILNSRDDLSYLFTTSGTTALPRLVPKTQYNFLEALITPMVARDRTIGAGIPLRVLSYMPMAIPYGAVVATSALVSGGLVAFMPGFDAQEIYRWMDVYRPTLLAGAPPMYEQLLALAPQKQAILARHSIRYINTGGSPLSAATRAGLHQVFGAPIIKVYAMTEVNMIASRVIPPGSDDVVEIAGRAEHVENTRVMTFDGSFLPPGDVGEIVVRYPPFTGYWNNPEASEDAFIDGWFRTGDEGSMDAEGNVTILGRIKEVINSGGAKVSPQEVEAVLKQHSEVADAVVFGIRHPEIGEAVAAAVVGTASERELRKFASERLPFYKVPMRIILVDKIPTAASGKVQRNRLAELLDLK